MTSLKLAKRKAKAHQRYTTPGLREGFEAGLPCVGVTTVLGVLGKPALIPWANKLGLQGIEVSKYVDALARIGTLTHYLVECDVKGIEPQTDDYSPNELKSAMVGFGKWIEWKSQHKFELVASELQLASDSLQYGGTCDILAYVDGVLTVLDIKTSKACYSEHKTQVVAYKELVRENGYSAEVCRIIRIGRDENEGFEDITVGSHELHWRLFESALAVYWSLSNLKNAE